MKQLFQHSTLALLATVIFSFAVVPLASAQTISQLNPPRTSSYPVYTVNPLSNCATTQVTLHGNQAPTVSCLKARTTVHVMPDINITSCWNNWTLSIQGDQGHVCFVGTGYVAFHMTHASYFYAPGPYNGWVKMYPSGTQNALFWSFFSGEYRQNAYPFNSTYDLTQICNNC